MNWYFQVLKKYAVFDGRARRREFWTFSLVNFIVSVIVAGIEASVTYNSDIGTLTILYSLAMAIPSIAVTVRRLHDTNHSGWWILISWIPIVSLIVLVFLLEDSQPGTNKYGPNPKDNTTQETKKDAKDGLLDGTSAASYVAAAGDESRCSHCGQLVGSEDRFCPSCGRPRESLCPSCKMPVSSEARFCGHCGKTLSGAQER